MNRSQEHAFPGLSGSTFSGRIAAAPIFEAGVVSFLVAVAGKPEDYDDIDIQTLQLFGNYLCRRRRHTEAETALRSSERQHKALSNDLRVLTARLNNVREEETALLAREIHDELGQELTGLKMELSWMASRFEDHQQDLRERAIRVLAHIDASVGTVRDITARLRPAILDHLGLVAAIEWHTQDFEKRSGIACEVVANTSAAGLEPSRAIALYRIVQEAMTNVARHAGATRIDIALHEQDGALALEIRDNGRGMQSGAASQFQSIGLLGMRERAIAAGGDFRIEGVPGKGTIVSVRLHGAEAGERSAA